jgi:uncharacterized protein DUF2848
MSAQISFDLLPKSGGSRRVQVSVENLVLAGWTGRDRAAVEAHIKEMAELGIPAPRTTPIFYRVGASLLTTASAVDVVGRESTGEVEFILFYCGDQIWVGTGSDQTDRKAEAAGITLAKQMCPKIVAPEAWTLADIEPHWDELVLRAYAIADGKRSLYQEAKVSTMIAPRDLLRFYGHFIPGTLMFSGTIPVVGGFRWADRFSFELEDPVLGRRLAHSYDIRALPVEG